MYSKLINYSKRTFAQQLRPKTVEQTQLFINGKYVNSISGRTMPVINPSTKEEIIQVSEAGTDDIDAAVSAARNAFDNGPWTEYSAKDRSRILYKISDLIERDFDTLAALETLDNGKPISSSRGDVGLAIEYFRYMSALARNIHGDTIASDGPFDVKTIRELSLNDNIIRVYSIFIIIY